MKTTDCIIRKFPTGELIALFPAHPGDRNPDTCLSYQSLGQHGAASVSLMRSTSSPSYEEQHPLVRELERLGYALRFCEGFTAAHRRARVTATQR